MSLKSLYLNINDKVRVTHYGHLLITATEINIGILISKGAGLFRYDILPEIVGKEGYKEV